MMEPKSNHMTHLLYVGEQPAHVSKVVHDIAPDGDGNKKRWTTVTITANKTEESVVVKMPDSLLFALSLETAQGTLDDKSTKTLETILAMADNGAEFGSKVIKQGAQRAKKAVASFVDSLVDKG